MNPFRRWIPLLVLLTALPAARKPPVFDPEKCRAEVERAIERDRYEKAMEILTNNQERLASPWVTNTRVRIYAGMLDYSNWYDYLAAMPHGTARLGYLSGYHGFLQHFNQALFGFQEYFESGGRASDLVSNSFLLTLHEFWVPGHWVLSHETVNRQYFGYRVYRYLMPWGSSLTFYFTDSREYGVESEDLNRSTSRLFRAIVTNGGFTPSEVAYRPQSASLVGLFTNKVLPWSDPKAVVIGNLGENPARMRRRLIFCLLPGRGCDYVASDFIKGGMLYDLQWFYGGPEEPATLRDVESLLNSLVQFK